MKFMLRIVHRAGIAAALIAGLALSACASKQANDAMASAGVASPGSQQDFVVNVGDRVFFEIRFHRAHAAVARDPRQAGAVAAAVRQLHVHGRRPRRRARHARIQHRARRPPRPDRARLSGRPGHPDLGACARCPTARSGRSRSATTSRAGRRTAARSPCSAPPPDGRSCRPWLKPSIAGAPQGAGLLCGAANMTSHTLVLIGRYATHRRQLEVLRHEQRDIPRAYRQRRSPRRFAFDRAAAQDGAVAAVGARPHVRQPAAGRRSAAGPRPGRRPSRCCASSASRSMLRQVTGTDRAVAVPQPAARSADPQHGRQSGRPSRRPGQGAAAPPRTVRADGQPLPPVRGRARRFSPARFRRRRPRVPGRRSDVFDPTQNPNAPGVPRTLGSLSSDGAPHEPPPIVTAEPPVGAPGGRGAGAPLDLSTLATGRPPARRAGPAAAGRRLAQRAAACCRRRRRAIPAPPARSRRSRRPPSSRRTIYDLAYGYVLRKDYALAEDDLRRVPEEVSERSPRSRRAILARRKPVPAPALRRRGAVLPRPVDQASARHAKAPDALLRLGQSLAALKQKEMACATLAEIGRKYPQGVQQREAGRRARAEACPAADDAARR